MKELNQLLSKLIKNGAGKKYYLLSILGMSIAILLILSAIQLQANFHDLLNNKNNQDSIANFLVLNKKLTNQNIGSAQLSATDIQQLKSQSFIDAVGQLSPSQFKASIQSSSNRFPFYTEISFESVPEPFIDVRLTEWNWSPNDSYIPIIVPNLFLDIYNFQFSFSQNLPQLSQDLVKMVSFTISVYGSNGNKQDFTARVVGFSDRIGSILVPEKFLDFGNKYAGIKTQTNSSRVIIRTKDPGNPALVNYLKDNQLTTDADKTRFSKYRQIVNLVADISWITGLVLLLFALMVFSLFIQLTIASCKEEINLLITLGVSHKQLGTYLIKKFFPIHIWIIVASLITISIVQFLLSKYTTQHQIFLNPFTSIYTLGAGLLMLVFIYGINRWTIQKQL